MNKKILFIISISMFFLSQALAADILREGEIDNCEKNYRRARTEWQTREDHQCATETLTHNKPRGGLQRDDRWRVTHTTKRKYQAIGQLKLTFPKGSAVGTGFLISERDVLTAAHCLYDPELGGWATSITFIPARDGTHKPLGRAHGKEWQVPKEWRKEQDSTFDYGIITLNGSVDSNFFRLRSHPKALLEDENYNITGYPGDVGKRGEMWTIRGPLYNVDRFRLAYALDTTGGQSGAPIWRQCGCKYSHNICVGVHTVGFTKYCAEKVNSGVRFRSVDLKNIRKMVRHNHAKIESDSLLNRFQQWTLN